MNFTETQGGGLSEKRDSNKCRKEEDVLERPVVYGLKFWGTQKKKVDLKESKILLPFYLNLNDVRSRVTLLILI